MLDPNQLSPDGSTSVSQFAPSPDAKWLAYAVAKGGADWETVRVRNVATGEDLADEVAWVRFSELSWTHDSQGFFYSRYPEPPKHKVLEAALSGQAVYYHRLGTPQSRRSADLSAPGSPVVDRQRHGQRRRPLRLPHARIAAPTTTTSCTSSTWNTRARRRISATIRPIVETLDAEFTPIGNYGSRIYVRSDKDAPNRCVIAIDLEDPDPASWKVVVPEQAEPIEHARVVGGRIIVHQLVDVQSRLRVIGLDGQPSSEIALPAVGSIAEIHGRSRSL